jgi:hypothetical protein
LKEGTLYRKLGKRTMLSSKYSATTIKHLNNNSNNSATKNTHVKRCKNNIDLSDYLLNVAKTTTTVVNKDQNILARQQNLHDEIFYANNINSDDNTHDNNENEDDDDDADDEDNDAGIASSSMVLSSASSLSHIPPPPTPTPPSSFSNNHTESTLTVVPIDREAPSYDK